LFFQTPHRLASLLGKKRALELPIIQYNSWQSRKVPSLSRFENVLHWTMLLWHLY
jgi:hypothetical protein